MAGGAFAQCDEAFGVQAWSGGDEGLCRPFIVAGFATGVSCKLRRQALRYGLL